MVFCLRASKRRELPAAPACDKVSQQARIALVPMASAVASSVGGDFCWSKWSVVILWGFVLVAFCLKFFILFLIDGLFGCFDGRFWAVQAGHLTSNNAQNPRLTAR